MLTLSEKIKLYKNARRGARWLDEERPGWASRVDPALLDMSRTNACVCGQVFRAEALVDYDAESGFDFFEGQYAEYDAVKFGFEADGNLQSGPSRQYDVLYEAWVQLIKERA